MTTRQGAVVEFRTAIVRAVITRPANADQYSAGDVATSAADKPLVFSGAARSDVMTGSIEYARIHSSANQGTKADLEMWLFNAEPPDRADNLAFEPSDALLDNLVGIIEFPVNNWKSGHPTSGAGGNAVCEAGSLAIPFRLSRPGTPLYGVLVVRNTYTPVSGETFTVSLGIYQD